MNEKAPVIVWFRQDLRLSDHPALIKAAQQNAAVFPVYILDDQNAGAHKMGGASRWWLHHSLKALDESLNGKLAVYHGDAAALIPRLAKDHNAQAVYWNRCYEPWRIERDKTIKDTLHGMNVSAESFNGCLLWEPWQTLKDDGTPYKVFTPFYKKGCLARNGEPPPPQDKPHKMTLIESKATDSAQINDILPLPAINWYGRMEEEWTPGEIGARKRLDTFLENGLRDYKEGRNLPDRRNVSRLSPHLHYGEISPRTVWHRATAHMVADHCETDGETFRSELGWREFSHNLLYYFPTLPRDNLQEKFNAFPWNKDDNALLAWQRGQTGYPIVDAGMRELWQTGYMHNRVRMIVGSFLVKHLLLHWHHGEAWFWDTLLDADLANNSASWQWIAGCGADAAPYFRIFNPITQGQKFDPDGRYTRQYVPELAKIPDKYLFSPWEAPAHVLEAAGVTLGKNYPKPLVDHSTARQRALDAFAEIKST